MASLTITVWRGHSICAAEKERSGLTSRNQRRTSAHRPMSALFCAHRRWAFLLNGGRCAGAARLAGPLAGTSTAHRPSPSIDVGGGGLRTPEEPSTCVQHVHPRADVSRLRLVADSPRTSSVCSTKNVHRSSICGRAAHFHAALSGSSRGRASGLEASSRWSTSNSTMEKWPASSKRRMECFFCSRCLASFSITLKKTAQTALLEQRAMSGASLPVCAEFGLTDRFASANNRVDLRLTKTYPIRES